MKHFLVLSSFLAGCAGATFGQSAQIAYDPDPVPQSMHECLLVDQYNISEVQPEISSNNCVEFNGLAQTNIIINDTLNVTNVRAGKSIHLLPNVHIKSETHLKIDSDYKLAWYAPSNVGQAYHYQKMEIGMCLPAPLMTEIERFFNVNDAFTGMNPFNRHKFDLEMTISQGGVPIDKVDAFYYVPQKVVNDQIVSDTTSFPFRFRHSPRVTGWILADIRVIINGVAVKNIKFSINVLPSQNKGFLEKSQFKQHLRFSKTKNSFFGVGQAIPWTEWPDWFDWHEKADFQRLHAELGFPFEKLNEAGGNMSRIVASEWSLQLEVEELGNYENRMDHAWYLDKLTDFCTLEEVYYILCMRTHGELVQGDAATYDAYNKTGWFNSPYYANHPPTPFASEPSIGITETKEFYSDPMAKDHFKNYMRYVVSRWGYASSIVGWQLMSEINDTGEYEKESVPNDYSAPQRDVIHQWIDEMAAFLDTVQFDRHLTSVAVVGEKISGLSKLHSMELFGSEYIDFTGLHTYAIQSVSGTPGSNDPGLGNFRNRGLLFTFGAVRNMTTGSNGSTNIPLAKYQNKPFIFDEYGLTMANSSSNGLDVVKNFNNCENHQFHNDLWASACSGSFATGLDWWQHHNPTRHQQWMDEFYGISSFFSDIDFEALNYSDLKYSNEMGVYIAQRWPWKEEKIKETDHTDDENPYNNADAVEAFTMVSSDKNQAFGWAHNRSYYWYNLQNENPCIAAMVNGQAPWAEPVIFRALDDDIYPSYRPVELGEDYIEIRDLRIAKDYTIRFYNPQTNQLLAISWKTSGLDGDLRVKIPVISYLHQDIAFKVTREGENWKSMETFPNDSTIFKTDDAFYDNTVVVPNPNQGEFVIDARGKEIKRICILDAKGQLLYEERGIDQTRKKINTSLPSGVYFIQLELANGEVRTEKLIIQP